MKPHRLRYLCAAPLVGLSTIGLASDATVPVLHANQIGLGPGDAKLAILATDLPRPAHWRLTDPAGRIVMAGEALPFGADAASGDKVQTIDLSGLRRTGRYTLSVPGAEPIAINVATRTLGALKYTALAMRCWRDANYAYSMNEVAINWNAPLVWVTAYLDSPPGKKR